MSGITAKRTADNIKNQKTKRAEKPLKIIGNTALLHLDKSIKDRTYGI